MLESHDQITGVADLKSKGKILSHTAKAQGKVHRFDSRVAKADPNSPNTFSKFLSRPARHNISTSILKFATVEYQILHPYESKKIIFVHEYFPYTYA